MHIGNGSVMNGEQPVRKKLRIEEADSNQGRGLGRSVSLAGCLSNEVLKMVFSYTTLRDRSALQRTCRRFCEVGKTPGVVERQVVNTYESSSLPQGACIANSDQVFITMLSKETGVLMRRRPHLAHYLLAVHLGIAPYRCLKTLSGPDGHTDQVTGVIWLGHGQIASCSGDGTIKIWNIETGQCLRTLDALAGYALNIRNMARLENGQLASCFLDRIRIWDVETGQCLKTLSELAEYWGNSIMSLTPLDNVRLASCSADTIKIWNVETGQLLKTLKDMNEQMILGMAYLGENRLASFGRDGTIKVSNLETGQRLKTLTGHIDLVKNVISIGNGQLASCSLDRTIRIWDVETGRCLHILRARTGYDITSLTYLGNGQLASCYDDKTINIWNVNTGRCLKTLGSSEKLTSVAHLGCGQFASGSFDGSIKIWGYGNISLHGNPS